MFDDIRHSAFHSAIPHLSFTLRPVTDPDRPWLRELMREHWGSELMVDRDRQYYPAEQAGWIAADGDEPVGVITYHVADGQCEVTSLTSLRREQGVGGALLDATVAVARAQGCKRLWLITTNDNLTALRFYQKRGLRLAALYPGEIEHARQHKPEIPLIGENGIPIRDELELQLIL